MPTKSTRIYHLFLLLVLINIAAFYAFVGSSQLDTNNSKDTNYLIATSVAIAIIWFVYYLFRHKLTSRLLLWAHLLVVAVCVLAIPSLTKTFVATPRRYLELNSQSFELSNFFGSMTTAFVVQLILLTLSLIFLLLSIRGHTRTTTNLFLEKM